ncbi:MAG: hypothetical protein EBZ78_10525 [Verrucomicrobia bacterium]|nr:hypothetical protein [Verrucomicrobiota bacterium]
MQTSFAAPSELNFQGVLLDASGNGVTGTRAMTVKLYDAAIGGNLLYTEDLGNVAVNKGVYSFNFGTNGTSNAGVMETVAIRTVPQPRSRRFSATRILWLEALL